MRINNRDARRLLSGAFSSDTEDEESAAQVLWIDEASYTRLPLIESLKQYGDVHLFLKIAGIVWPTQDCSLVETVAQIAWNCTVRVVMIACPTLILFNFFHYLLGSVSFAGFELSSWSLDVIFIMQSVSLLSSLVAVRKRLCSVSTSLEVSFFGTSLKYCIIYFALSFFPSILYPLYHILLIMPMDDRNITSVQLVVYSILPLCELIVSGFLAVHMLFILVDMQTLAASFHEITTDSNDDHRSSKRAGIVLSEIHHRVRTSLCEVLPIVITALLEITVLCYMVRNDYLARDYMPMLLLIFLFLKEIQFLLLVIGCAVYCATKRMFLVHKKKV